MCVCVMIHVYSKVLLYVSFMYSKSTKRNRQQKFFYSMLCRVAIVGGVCGKTLPKQNVDSVLRLSTTFVAVAFWFSGHDEKNLCRVCVTVCLTLTLLCVCGTSPPKNMCVSVTYCFQFIPRSLIFLIPRWRYRKIVFLALVCVCVCVCLTLCYWLRF